MDLSKLSIEPRLRNGWQAIDLGFAMARQWWWPCFLAWIIPAAVVFLVLSFTLHRYPWLVIILLWWLKPLWDRLPLVIASRALFGDPPQLWPTLRNIRHIFKTDWFASLTYRRFSLSRSFDLPVTVLEGLRKSARRNRLAVLHQSYGNAATGLTVVSMHVEMFLAIGALSSLLLLVPKELLDEPQTFLSSQQFLTNLVTFFAMALAAPFYCLAGFALYINRRIQLEGWDIEIRFRHLLERNKLKQKMNKAAASVLPLLLSGLLLLHAPQGEAEEVLESPEYLQDYYQQLSKGGADGNSKKNMVEVLSGPDFFLVEMEKGWRFKSSEPTENDFHFILGLAELFDKWRALSKPLRGGMSSFAGVFEVAIWILLGGLLAYVVYRYRRGLLQVFNYVSPRREQRAQPELMFGLDVREESLPDNVGDQVLVLWDDGREREALSLLYRATLSRLIHQFAFEFYAGFTEQECVAVVEQAEKAAVSDYLTQLTRVWQQLAYAHQIPQREKIRALCNAWQALFGEKERVA